jgi:hypothetical protein
MNAGTRERHGGSILYYGQQDNEVVRVNPNREEMLYSLHYYKSTMNLLLFSNYNGR